MHKTIEAVYEKGAIKPLEPLALSESQKITVTIETTESRVASTKALIKADPDVVRQVAESDDYLYDAHTPPCR
ncbi:MAG: antitoxin family protein [Pseudomonadota bacterium]|jgi:predicted DNA-binding antitoxin AbrB/MazE fold protein